MKEFNLIRHGQKLETGATRKSFGDSGLSPDQQAKWAEAVKRLNLKDPELAYEALPKIEQLAGEIYNSLPEKALLIFVSTDTPRTKLAADLLSCEIINIIAQQKEKDISVVFLWEPPEEESKPDSLKKVLVGDIMERMRIIMRQDNIDDESIREYFESDGKTTFPMEDEIVRKAINEDIASEDSSIRKRGDLLRKHYEKISEQFKNEDRPVFFYGLSHQLRDSQLRISFYAVNCVQFKSYVSALFLKFFSFHSLSLH